MSADRVLVTGGAGFIGSHVTDLLLAQGRAVRILDNLELPTHEHKPEIPAGAEFIQGDVRRADDLERALRSMDAVVHLAATGGFTADIARYVEVNALGTARLLEAAARRGVAKFVLASSVGVYGEGRYRCASHGVQPAAARTDEALQRGEWEIPCPLCGLPMSGAPIPEDSVARPRHPYSISKLTQEHLVLSAEMPAAVLRFFLTYGPRQSLSNPYTGVVSLFSARLLEGLPPLLYEDGRQTRDFVFVEDVARAVVLALEEIEGEVLNVGTGTPTRIDEVARTLARIFGREVEPEVPGYYRPGEVRHLVADVSRLRARGWAPRVGLEEGLERFADWILGQPDVRDRLGAAFPELRRTGVVRPRAAADAEAEGLSVIVPAYNEAGNLDSVIAYLLAELPAVTDDFEILIVDDGSRDGTGVQADRLAGRDERVRVIHHSFNIGYGGAQKSGFAAARKGWVVVVPADHQFDARDLGRLWEQRTNCDLVASRRLERVDPWSRRVVSRVYNWMMRAFYGIPLRDINWVKMWRRSLFERVTIDCRGFGVDAELVAKAHALGYRFGEIGVPHHRRTWGSGTSIKLGTLWHTGRELLRIRGMLRRIRGADDANPA